MNDARPAADAPGGPPVSAHDARVAGVVLCGGGSRRMGADKARALLGGRTLLERAVELLRAHAEPVLLACGPTPRYAELGLPLVLDPPELAGGALAPGPAAGLCAALEATDAELVVVLACDMPRVESALIERLIADARARQLDACIFESAGGLEPLCGAYRPAVAAAVRAALASGRCEVLAFRDFPRADGRPIEFGTVAERTLGPELRARDMARNLNHPEELARERSGVGEGSAA